MLGFHTRWAETSWTGKELPTFKTTLRQFLTAIPWRSSLPPNIQNYYFHMSPQTLMQEVGVVGVTHNPRPKKWGSAAPNNDRELVISQSEILQDPKYKQTLCHPRKQCRSTSGKQPDSGNLSDSDVKRVACKNSAGSFNCYTGRQGKRETTATKEWGWVQYYC
jgi:hypothetical protein